jgi:ribosome biogenesis protein SSF1/2
VLKDFISIAGPIGVSHIITFTKQSETSLNMRFIRLPQGPTLNFKVVNYLLAREVLATFKRPVYYQGLFGSSPLVIMHGLNGSNDRELNLIQTFVENMFPTINVDTVCLSHSHF